MRPVVVAEKFHPGSGVSRNPGDLRKYVRLWENLLIVETHCRLRVSCRENGDICCSSKLEKRNGQQRDDDDRGGESAFGRKIFFNDR